MALSRLAFPFVNIAPQTQQCTSAFHYIMVTRQISTIPINKNLTLLTRHHPHHKRKVKVDKLKLEGVDGKPLVVMLSWLMAKQKHVKKYADFYIKRGFDVIHINITPWQLLWPVKGTQLVARDIVQFLHTNPSYGPLVVHGFSVGGYVWSEALVQLAAETDRYQHIIDRISGQIWDSAADVTEIPVGLPFAVFPKNKTMQNILRKYIIYHMKAFDKVATCHYMRASQMFYTNIVRAPALFFISKSDPIGTERSNRRCKETWDNMGIQTYWKCWEATPHVGHFMHYPDEYLDELTRFIESIGFQQEMQRRQELEKAKIRAKL